VPPRSKSRAASATAAADPSAILAGAAAEPATLAMPPVVGALADPSPTVDDWLRGPGNAAPLAAALLHEQAFALRAAAVEGPHIPARRWLLLAEAEPDRFGWVIDPALVLPFDDSAVETAFQRILQPVLERGDLPVGIGWLQDASFLPAADAVRILERRLQHAEQGAGWLAIGNALAALHARGAGWKAARHLERLLDRFWLDAREAQALEHSAAGYADAGLLVALARHEPWRSKGERLLPLAERCATADLARTFIRSNLPQRLHAPAESCAFLQGLAWRVLRGRGEPEALDASARLLVLTAGDAVGAAHSMDAVIAMQRVHGDRAIAALVAVYLSGQHRAPHGELIDRWLLGRAEKGLLAALSTLPDWMPRFERSAMERLCWRLAPKLEAAARRRVREHAELTEGTRGEIALRELEG
jgi:hypothetical protein